MPPSAATMSATTELAGSGDRAVIFTETTLAGAFIVDVEMMGDERGGFARTWCAKEFAARGLAAVTVQSSIATNHLAGTLRGMHFQTPPYAEAKLVRCTRGAIYDVLIDIRAESASYLRWIGVELSDTNHRALYVPPGLAHGYQTLTDDTEIAYQMSEFYAPDAGRGVRWNDPAFEITWPPTNGRIMSQRDRDYPDFLLPSP